MRLTRILVTKRWCGMIFVMIFFFLVSYATAYDKVVVIPLLGEKATGNATKEDVLSGKTFSNSSATGLTGTRTPAPVGKTGQTVSYADGDDGDYQQGEDVMPRWGTTGGTGFGVKDHLTGLIWQNPLSVTMGAWGGYIGYDQLEYCEELVTGGQYSDWRMPNVKELLSLIDFGQYGPALPPFHPFFLVFADEYWTSTRSQIPTGPSQAWTVDLDSGLMQPRNVSSNLRVWCVRGPY